MMPSTQGGAQGASPGAGPPDDHRLVASMVRCGIPLTDENCALWDVYLAGTEPTLRRTIDIFLSNGSGLSEHTLRTLHGRFCTPGRERAALAEVLIRVQHRTDQLGEARGDAALQASLRELARLEGRLLTRLDRALLRIAEMERSLGEARREAVTDGLTGVANRRAFDAALRSMAGDAMNSGDDLAFMIVDIDRFKAVNDRWGHHTGDEVLRMVAQTLSKTVRGRDLVARYGGEEFGVILPQTACMGAMAVAENVREAVGAQALQGDTDAIHVTISVGVSIYEPGEALGSWVGRADAALYQAKRSGRNRACLGGAERQRATHLPQKLASGRH